MRRATIRTRLEDAAAIAEALRPDNTDEMDTRIEDDVLVTKIHRETTSGLRSTVDDYLVNLDLATTIADHANTETRHP